VKKKILGSIVLIAACWFVAFIIIEVNRELEWLGLAIFIGGIAYSGFNITKSLIQSVRESVFYNDKKAKELKVIILQE